MTGECKLKVGKDELDQWAFPKMALEHYSSDRFECACYRASGSKA